MDAIERTQFLRVLGISNERRFAQRRPYCFCGTLLATRNVPLNLDFGYLMPCSKVAVKTASLFLEIRYEFPGPKTIILLRSREAIRRRARYFRNHRLPLADQPCHETKQNAN